MFTGDHITDLTYYLIAVTGAAMVIERGLAYLFDSLARDVTWAANVINHGTFRATVALFVSLWVCVSFEVDLFRYLFPNASAYLVSSDEVIEAAKALAVQTVGQATEENMQNALEALSSSLRPTDGIGLLITAFALAGGSAGMISLFQGVLGMSSQARAAKAAERQARATAAWVSARGSATRQNANLPPIRDLTRAAGFAAGRARPFKNARHGIAASGPDGDSRVLKLGS